MQIEARHVKRKQLNQYLDKDFLSRDRKIAEASNTPCPITAAKKRISSELARSRSQDTPPPTKKPRHSESVSKSAIPIPHICQKIVAPKSSAPEINQPIILPLQFDDSPLPTPDTSMTNVKLAPADSTGDVPSPSTSPQPQQSHTVNKNAVAAAASAAACT